MKFISNLSEETLLCSELLVKDYKDLLKCSYGDSPNEIIFAETICEIFSNITKKPVIHLKQLNLIDLFSLLLDVRINSQGDICKVIITKDEKNMKLELKLDLIHEEIKHIFESFNDCVVEIKNGIKIVLGCPSIERLIQKTDEEYLNFFQSIVTNDGKKIQIQNNTEASLLFKTLSPKDSIAVLKKFNLIAGKLNKINFLSRYGLKEQTLTFYPTLDSFIWFTKLIFSESLETFYDNLFYLSHLGHLNGEYVENLVVGEYNYFISCLQRTLAVDNSSNKIEEQIEFGENDGFLDGSM